MPEVNYLAVVLAALSAFLLGGLWYSPALFAGRWTAASGQSEERLKGGSMATIFGGAFLLNLVAAYVLAWALQMMGASPRLPFAAILGFTIGLCWVGASFGVSYLFERRPFALWLINAGYFTLQFTLMGAIIGAMG